MHINYCMILRSIEHFSPEARFIHIIRDGRDVALSLRETWFAPSRDMVDLARYWKHRVESARTLGARCRHYREARYEDLVLRPREILLQLCQFIDLSFEEGMESHHLSAGQRLGELGPYLQSDGSVLVPREQRLRIHHFSTQPPDASRIGRWRHAMRQEEQEAFASAAGPLLDELGYL